MIAASTLTAEVRNDIIKVMRLQDIQKSHPFTTPEWEAASEMLSPLFEKLHNANAPHQDNIDWSA